MTIIITEDSITFPGEQITPDEQICLTRDCQLAFTTDTEPDVHVSVRYDDGDVVEWAAQRLGEVPMKLMLATAARDSIEASVESDGSVREAWVTICKDDNLAMVKLKVFDCINMSQIT